MRLLNVLLVVGLGAVSVLGAGCHDDPPPQPPPQPPPPPPQTQTATPPPPPAPVGGPCTQVAPAAGDAAAPVLDQMAKTDAKNMKAEGAPFAGQCAEGQTVTQTFNATPGKCYTVFAVGLGSQQLDIVASTLSPSPAIPPIQVAQSTTTGPNATIGGGGNCVKYDFPAGAPFTITVKSSKGSGVVVARVYSK
jgi:hypothetical protein